MAEWEFSTTPEAERSLLGDSISFSFLHKCTRTHTSQSWRGCCAAELSSAQVRSEGLFLQAGMEREGVQVSDWCLMDLGTHTHLSDRLAPGPQHRARCHHHDITDKH